MKPKDVNKEKEKIVVETKSKQKKSNLDLLLEFDDISVAPVLTPSLGGFLTPMAETTTNIVTDIQIVSTSSVITKPMELLNRISGRGLSITYRFTRNPHLFSSSMVNIGLIFTNHSNEDITNIRLGKKVYYLGCFCMSFFSLMFFVLVIGNWNECT